jgi:hypothetical protein
MSLIPSLSFLELVAAVPLVMVLGPLFLSALQNILSNPLVASAINTISLVLNTTEIVWRPVWNASLMVSKQILSGYLVLAPILKSLILSGVNTTLTLVRTAQAMGVSFTTAFPIVMIRIKEVGEAFLVIGRSLGLAVYYVTKGVALLLGSVETLFLFGKQLLFEAHLMTADDFYNVMLPFAIVLSTIATLYWIRKTPQPVQTRGAFQPRRSSRLARKRAFLCAQDVSDALPVPACKKAFATSSNL